MATTFTYSISADFPDGKVYIPNLYREIAESTITIAIDSISSAADTLTIVFKAPLPAADKTTLDGNTTNPAGGLIANHNSTPADTEINTIPGDFLVGLSNGERSGETFVGKFGERTIPSSGVPNVIGYDSGNITIRLPAPEPMTIESTNANDASAGTGAKACFVTGISTGDAEVNELAHMNGTTKVNLANPYRVIHRIVVLAAGSGETNLGEIIISDQATGTTILGKIEPGVGITGQAWYMVPSGKTLYIRQLLFVADTTSGGDPTITWRVYFYSNTTGLGESRVQGYKVIQDVASVGNLTERSGFLVSKATEGTFITVVAESDKTNTTCRTSFFGVLVDNV